MSTPPEGTEIASAQRVIGADVAKVYAAVEGIGEWSTWIGGVVEPVSTVDADAYKVTSLQGGTPKTHDLRVTARGPVHSLVTQVDGRYEVRWTIRPHALGTDVEVRAHDLGKPSLRARLFRRRRVETYSGQLRDALADLAAHVEAS